MSNIKKKLQDFINFEKDKYYKENFNKEFISNNISKYNDNIGILPCLFMSGCVIFTALIFTKLLILISDIKSIPLFLLCLFVVLLFIYPASKFLCNFSTKVDYLSQKSKINNFFSKETENNRQKYSYILEEEFSKQPISDELNYLLKIELPINLYNILYIKGCHNYNDLNSFLENMDDYELKLEKIENEKISINKDILINSDFLKVIK